MDLPQGGLELPCEHMFTGSEDIVCRTRQRLMKKRVVISEIHSTSTNDEFSEDKVKNKDVITIKEEAIDISTGSDDNMMAWVKIKDTSLTMEDKKIIEEGHMLIDKHIILAQRMIKQKFPSLTGLCLTFFAR